MQISFNNRLRFKAISLWILLLSLNCLPLWSQENLSSAGRRTIEGNWSFRQADTANWLPAKVPGNVHMDLLRNGKIEDPFWGTNEKKLQWIENKNWQYKGTFLLDKKEMQKAHAQLIFKGLDTYAEVTLNGKKILSANNMFREWTVPVQGILKEGENTLEVIFRSPIREVMHKYDSLPFHYPANNDQAEKKVSIFTRKAGFHYGWDWGPRFVTSGIWRPIFLETWDNVKINHVQLVQKSLTTDKAVLLAKVEVEVAKPLDLRIAVKGDEPSVSSPGKSQKVSQGIVTIDVPINISNPKLWWPNSLGEHPLYNIHFTLYAGNEKLDEQTERTGLRTVEVVNKDDANGRSLFVKVNGSPLFMKGANYIPSDNFQNRVDEKKYKMLVGSAVEANMNMLRVWGGGIYEEDKFYELCDENGILLWQDFMFGCSMFPGDTAFLLNVSKEAEDNVRRLRNHPSIALWCGNNEMETAWEHWGWQKEHGYTKAQEELIWGDYKKIFHTIIPGVVARLDSSRYYHRSSPSANDDRYEADKIGYGDKHYWGVWHAEEPYQNYKKNISRFMSEYGFQSFPELSTVKKYASPDQWNIESVVMLHHQRHPRGNQLVRKYMDRDYKTPKDFPSFLYVGQVLQAEIIKFGAEAHRRAMPYNMGSLYWQLDDCWPVASWSGIDYYGNWKALHYFARKFNGPILLSFNENGNAIETFIVSDKLENVKAGISLQLMDLSGKILWKKQSDTTIVANSSKIYFSINKSELLKGYNINEIVLHGVLKTGGKEYSNNFYFVPAKDLVLPPNKIQTQVNKSNEGFSIELSSPQLAKNVYLSGTTEGFFSDNYFDLLPGEKKRIQFKYTGKLTPEEFRKELKIVSLVDSY